MKILAGSEIAQTIDVTETVKYRRRYDAAAKKLVSQKAILAYILKSTMEEFQDVSVKQIAEELIEGTPKVSTIAVHQDTTDAPEDSEDSAVPDASVMLDISYTPDSSDAADVAPAGQERIGVERMSGSDRIPVGSVESTSIREGTVWYDIHFKVCVPGTEGEPVEVIVNVEVQNHDLPGYPIPKRAVYYVARLISVQRGEVFKDQEYGKIKKAVSIWICLDTALKRSDTINEYRLQEIRRRGEYREEEKNYDLMRIFVLRLGDRGEESEDQVVRLLSGLLSAEKTAAEKKKMLSEEFYIDMTEEIDQEVSSMCNLSEGIFEKGIQAGIVRGRAEGMETGIVRGRAEGMEAGIAKGRAEGMEAGEAIGRMKVLFGLVRNGTLTISMAAEAAAMEPSEFERQYNESLLQLR